MKKRITSLFLVLVLALANPSVTILAAENEDLSLMTDSQEILNISEEPFDAALDESEESDSGQLTEETGDAAALEEDALSSDSLVEDLPAEDDPADSVQEPEIFEEYPDGLIEIEEDEEDLDSSDETSFDLSDGETAVLEDSSDEAGIDGEIILEDTVDAAPLSDLVVLEEGDAGDASDSASTAAAQEVDFSEEEPSEEVSSDAEDALANWPEGMVLTEQQEMKIAIPGGENDNDELFESYMERAVFGLVSPVKKLRSAARLSGTEAAIYNQLLPQIREVAAGERTSTVFEIAAEDMGFEKLSWTAAELGVSSLIEKDDQGNAMISSEAKTALAEHTAYDFNLVLRALLSNCPYELYWFDKTTGTSYGGLMIHVGTDSDLNELVMSYSGTASFSFAVSDNYRAGSNKYEVNPNEAQRAKTAAENADQIVSDCAGLSDEEKLREYKTRICALVDYNHPAADEGASYGDPWQLVWVFDGDSSTTVVCEGYSKAFQYLFDKSSFSDPIECYTVTGWMDGGTGAGAHMWNVVHMDDQRNYLADVTNSDTGTVGSGGELFLASTDQGSAAEGYTFPGRSKDIVYTYDDKTKNYFGLDLLTISSTPYMAHTHHMEYIPAADATCTEDGHYDYWYCSGCGRYFSDAAGTDQISFADTVTPASGHSFTHVEAVQATCTNGGNIEYWHCDKCGNYYSDAAGTNQIALEDTVTAAAGHSFTHVAAADPTCTTDGNIEYWQCDKCGNYYSDAAGTNQISPEDRVIAAEGHSLIHFEAVQATCTNGGSIEYWHCDKCGNYYSDAAGKDQISLADTVTAASGHSFTHVEAVQATCTNGGNIEYWHCDKCGNYYSDAAGTNQIALEDTVTAAAGHSFTHVAAADPTCTTEGNIEYWQCSQCGKLWADSEGSIPLEEADVVTAATGHSLEHVEEVPKSCTTDGHIEYWHCEDCNNYFADAEGTKAVTIEETVIPKGHTPGETVIEDGREATCESAGSHDEVVYCADCAEEISRKTVTDPQKAHSLTEHVERLGATLKAEGHIEYWQCSECGGFFADAAGTNQITQQDTVIPKLVDIGTASVSGITNKTYTGSAITQTPAVVLEAGSKLTTGTDYEVTYKDNTNAGTATVVITGKGRYAGTKTVTFTISPKTITPVVSLSAYSYTWSGTAPKPAVTVKDGSKVLKAGTDYTVPALDGNVNAGTYTVKVALTGNYSGSGSASYTIKAKAVTPTVTLSKSSYTWNNKVQTPAVTVKAGTIVLKKDTDYTVTLPSGRKKAGTYTIMVTLKGNYSGSGSASYKITPKKITPAVTLSATAYTYDGKVKKPAVTVKYGKTKLAAGNYKVEYASGRKNVGAYKVTVTMKGNYSGSKAVTFKINPKKTAIRSVISPAKGTLRVTWVKQAVQTTGYQIQYSLSKTFKSGTKTITVKGPKVITRNITGLRGGKIYYVRVRTFRTVRGTHYFSGWSSVKYRAVRR